MSHLEEYFQSCFENGVSIKEYSPIKSSFITYHDESIYNSHDILGISVPSGPSGPSGPSRETDCKNTGLFGIVEVEMKDVPVINKPVFLYFTVDESGSMLDLCKNGKSKLWFVQQTFRKMLLFISNTPDAEVYIKVVTFNENVQTIIDTIQVLPENVDYLIKKIKNIKPTGSTNIENALLVSNENITEHTRLYPEHRNTHIFLTDGDITSGCTCFDTLCNIVETSEINQRSVFIGFGDMHNYRLLNRLGETKRGEYRFIDNGEKSGVVYGEVLSRILRPAIEEVSIVITNGGELYDWQTNTWVDTIYEDLIDSQAKKIYHVRIPASDTYTPNTDDLQNVHVIIRGKKPTVNIFANYAESQSVLDVVIPLPALIVYDSHDSIITVDDSCYENLMKYVFRQKVMEYLYLSRNSERVKNSEKTSIALFFKKMRIYMRENNLLDDPLMSILCEDLVVAYHYFGRNMTHVYNSARQISQGKQYLYTPTFKKINYNMRPPKLRRNNLHTISTDNDSDNDVDEGVIAKILGNIKASSFLRNIITATKDTTSSENSVASDEFEEEVNHDDDVDNNNDGVDDIENFIYSHPDSDSEELDEDELINRLTTSPYATSNRMNTIRAFTQSVGDE
uniref:VWFA domain-containing protein n=1 Tax=viral metagenome TaxID=1070528 RepID=A0A6C0DRJ3_9ZZZZ